MTAAKTRKHNAPFISSAGVTVAVIPARRAIRCWCASLLPLVVASIQEGGRARRPPSLRPSAQQAVTAMKRCCSDVSTACASSCRPRVDGLLPCQTDIRAHRRTASGGAPPRLTRGAVHEHPDTYADPGDARDGPHRVYDSVDEAAAVQSALGADQGAGGFELGACDDPAVFADAEPVRERERSVGEARVVGALQHVEVRADGAGQRVDDLFAGRAWGDQHCERLRPGVSYVEVTRRLPHETDGGGPGLRSDEGEDGWLRGRRADGMLVHVELLLRAPARPAVAVAGGRWGSAGWPAPFALSSL